MTAATPFWYAVVSTRAPTINKTFRRADAAEEWAEQCRATQPDAEVVPLYREPCDRAGDGKTLGAPTDFALVPLTPTPEMIAAAGATPGMKAIDNVLAIHAVRNGMRSIPGLGDTAETSALAEAYRAMVAAAPAAEPVCPRCDGAGEITVMSDGGPDAYEVPMNCDHCGGSGALADAYAQVAKRLEETSTKYTQLYGKVYFNRTDADLLRQAVEALEYHQEQTRPIQQTINALFMLKRRLAEVQAPATGDAA